MSKAFNDFMKEKDNVIKAVEEAVKVTAFDAFNTAIIMSPVGNPDLWQSDYVPDGYVGGRFRSSWKLAYSGKSVGGDAGIISHDR